MGESRFNLRAVIRAQRRVDPCKEAPAALRTVGIVHGNVIHAQTGLQRLSHSLEAPEHHVQPRPREASHRLLRQHRQHGVEPNLRFEHPPDRLRVGFRLEVVLRNADQVDRRPRRFLRANRKLPGEEAHGIDVALPHAAAVARRVHPAHGKRTVRHVDASLNVVVNHVRRTAVEHEYPARRVRFQNLQRLAELVLAAEHDLVFVHHRAGLTHVVGATHLVQRQRAPGAARHRVNQQKRILHAGQCAVCAQIVASLKWFHAQRPLFCQRLCHSSREAAALSAARCG